MSKLKIFSLLVLTTYLTACSSGKLTDQDQVSQHVFEILQDLGSSSKSEYMSHFITLEEVWELGKDERLIPEKAMRQRFATADRDEIEGELEADYEDLQRKAGEEGINWANIEYTSYIHDKASDGTIYIVEGMLSIKHEGTRYYIDVVTLWDGDEFKLCQIRNIYGR